MSEVFATINHRLSEEYTKIELPTSDAKERCVHSHHYLCPPKCGACSYLPFSPNHRLLTDARYLHEKFSVLKAPGTPTAVLETLVADKRVANAPLSPRPTTPTPMPAPTSTPTSPLSLPPTNIPLGSPRSAVQPPTKRPSLFSNERLKGILSRGTTQPQPQPSPPPISIPATTSSPPPTLTREKQGGYKQVAVLLSPTPLPAEKQRDLPTTPTLPIHATPSPLLSQEQLEPAASAPNVDAVDVGVDESGRHPGRVDGETDDGVSQGNGDVVFEKAPPPPAKDVDAASVSVT
jgi:vacuolar protein sorting-associated protein 54